LRKTYILGIGGMSAKARNTDIIEELMKKANLQTNEVLAYISVSRNINVDALGVLVIAKYTATGYVVRPKNGNYVDVVVESNKDTSYGNERYPDAIYKEGTYKRRMESKGGLREYINLSNKIFDAKNISDFAIIEEEILTKHREGIISDKDKSKLLSKISGQNLYNTIDGIIFYSSTGEQLLKHKEEIAKCDKLTEEQKEALIKKIDRRMKVR
jgi:hypothetical protein